MLRIYLMIDNDYHEHIDLDIRSRYPNETREDYKNEIFPNIKTSVQQWTEKNEIDHSKIDYRGVISPIGAITANITKD